MEINIRNLSGIKELRAAEQLQKEVWGFSDLETVHSGEMIAVRETGGTIIGAFADEHLIGFVFGFVGLENGEITIHSHLAAVRPEWRGQQIGYRLKLAQRELALQQNIRLITWTYDPLQSLNAYFNFSRLGVTARKYHVDFYGSDVDILVAGIGTDRLWAEWRLDSSRVSERIEKASGHIQSLSAAAIPLVTADQSGWPELNETTAISSTPDAPDLLIQIPRDIASIQKTDQELAREWRDVTRLAFTTALATDYRVTEFMPQEKYGSYLLTPAHKTEPAVQP